MIGNAGLLLLTAMLTLAACATRVAPEPSTAGNTPRISWRIWADSRDGSREPVCQSDAEQPCVIVATGPDEQRGSAISVYLHPGTTHARFSGAVFAGFLTGTDGGPGYELALRGYGVEPDRAPPLVAASGATVATPGAYVARVSLLAEVENRVDPYQISVVIPVQVIDAGAPRAGA